MAAKEFWALVPQPQLLLLLLVGPVLIMTAFGLSLDVRDILRPRALVVVEPGKRGRAALRALPGGVHRPHTDRGDDG